MNKGIFFLILFVSQLTSYGTNPTRLFVNEGDFVTVHNTTFPYLAFNESISFDQRNTRIELTEGDATILTISNNTAISLYIGIQDHSTYKTLDPSDSFTLDLSSLSAGTYILKDSSDHQFRGLSTMIVVHTANANYSHFYWNLKDHSSSFNTAMDTGGIVDWAQYYPDFFTINGNSNPAINNDTDARVVGSIGDSILIHISNTGRSVHAIHFHGYHVTILKPSAHPSHEGWIKDTYPVEGMSTVTFLLVPHQVGEYPVHDHNLVAVTGGGIYPNGMFSTILIQ